MTGISSIHKQQDTLTTMRVLHEHQTQMSTAHIASIRSALEHNPSAAFMILHLDNHGQHVGSTLLNSPLTPLRLVGLHTTVQDAIKYHATHMVMCEIRSGDDMTIRKAPNSSLKWAHVSLQHVGITLLDYMLVSSTHYYSFKEHRINPFIT